ncbi:MAG: SDR family oxidoreductase [Chloroflexi bacterium]|nr:SDR family oxidoreductase [Chloroflexota bacterium]
MNRLSDKVALVTGAGGWRAIGQAIALRLAAEGASVAVAGSTRPPYEIEDETGRHLWEGAVSVARQVEALGVPAMPLSFDIREEERVNEAVAAVIRRFGHIDILVNNAAAAGAGDRVPLVELPTSEWDRVVDTNLRGTFFVTRAVAQAMIEARRGGKIIIVSSINGRVGRADHGAYASSKFGLIGLTQVLAQELGQYKINVNAVCPGTVPTPRLDNNCKVRAPGLGLTWQELRDRHLEERRAQSPLGEVGTPEDIADLVAFLASPESKFITGQAIVADGGIVTI